MQRYGQKTSKIPPKWGFFPIRDPPRFFFKNRALSLLYPHGALTSCKKLASNTYAKAFYDNGFNEQSLALLDKETLTEIGITLLGHKLAILQCASKQHSPPAQSSSVAKATVNAHLSTLTLEMTRPQ